MNTHRSAATHGAICAFLGVIVTQGRIASAQDKDIPGGVLCRYPPCDTELDKACDGIESHSEWLGCADRYYGAPTENPTPEQLLARELERLQAIVGKTQWTDYDEKKLRDMEESLRKLGWVKSKITDIKSRWPEYGQFLEEYYLNYLNNLAQLRLTSLVESWIDIAASSIEGGYNEREAYDVQIAEATSLRTAWESKVKDPRTPWPEKEEAQDFIEQLGENIIRWEQQISELQHGACPRSVEYRNWREVCTDDPLSTRSMRDRVEAIRWTPDGGYEERFCDGRVRAWSSWPYENDPPPKPGDGPVPEWLSRYGRGWGDREHSIDFLADTEQRLDAVGRWSAENASWIGRWIPLNQAYSAPWNEPFHERVSEAFIHSQPDLRGPPVYRGGRPVNVE